MALTETEIRHAVKWNPVYAARTRWLRRFEQITHVLMFYNMTPGPELFADAVSRWQSAHGLKGDGIIGPRTWRKMEPWTRFSIDQRTLPTPNWLLFTPAPSDPGPDNEEEVRLEERREATGIERAARKHWSLAQVGSYGFSAGVVGAKQTHFVLQGWNKQPKRQDSRPLNDRARKNLLIEMDYCQFDLCFSAYPASIGSLSKTKARVGFDVSIPLTEEALAPNWLIPDIPKANMGHRPGLTARDFEGKAMSISMGGSVGIGFSTGIFILGMEVPADRMIDIVSDALEHWDTIDWDGNDAFKIELLRFCKAVSTGYGFSAGISLSGGFGAEGGVVHVQPHKWIADY